MTELILLTLGAAGLAVAGKAYSKSKQKQAGIVATTPPQTGPPPPASMSQAQINEDIRTWWIDKVGEVIQLTDMEVGALDADAGWVSWHLTWGAGYRSVSIDYHSCLVYGELPEYQGFVGSQYGMKRLGKLSGVKVPVIAEGLIIGPTSFREELYGGKNFNEWTMEERLMFPCLAYAFSLGTEVPGMPRPMDKAAMTLIAPDVYRATPSVARASWFVGIWRK